MRSTPEQDLQALQPAMQPMPQPMMQSQQPMPNPMPQPQMAPVTPPKPFSGDYYMNSAQMGPQGGKNQPGYTTDTMIQRNLEARPGGEKWGKPTSPDTSRQSIVKKAVKKSSGSSNKASGEKTPGVMKWLMDYLNKRHESSLNHEREVLKSILEEQRQRVDSGGSPVPESLQGGGEQAYFDNVRNTGNRI